jgi:hypothetical protein
MGVLSRTQVDSAGWMHGARLMVGVVQAQMIDVWTASVPWEVVCLE